MVSLTHQQSALADHQFVTSICNILINSFDVKRHFTSALAHRDVIDKDIANGCYKLAIGEC
jgi:hypothetical protein